jgi:hypothetical protein
MVWCATRAVLLACSPLAEPDAALDADLIYMVHLRFAGAIGLESVPCGCASSSFDSVWLGLQAFASASAFNANIGAWNTAAVSNMASVCAAFGLRRATAFGAPPQRTRSAGARCGEAGVHGGTTDACARLCARIRMGTRLRCPRVYV